MADIAVENKEIPVEKEAAEEVDATIVKKVEAAEAAEKPVKENGATTNAAAETKENGSNDVADTPESTSESSTADEKTPAVVDSVQKEAPAVAVEAKDTDAEMTDKTDLAAAEKKEVASEADAAKSNGDKKDVEKAEAGSTEETNGDSTDSPAETVKRKVVEEAESTSTDKKAKIEETKEDVTNGSEATEVAA